MLHRLERAVERFVDGTVAGVFRLRVQPAEIGRQLERTMLDGRVTSVGTTLAPNVFAVRLHPDDAASFAGWEDALGKEMELWLAELAFTRGLATVGPICVEIAADRGVPRRSVRVTGRFAAGGDAAFSPARPAEPRTVALHLVPATAEFSAFPLNGRSVSVGRAEGNDLILAHPEVSRRHARFEVSGAGWIVVDLGSRNGTWVNGQQVTKRPIAPGDEVAFGSVRFTIGA